jgi:Ni/Co efflux regulator RcnB
MKRAALGALLISLVAGSTAMAGTVFRADQYERERNQQHRPDNRSDNGHRNDRGNHQRNDSRNHGRNDRRDDHRDHDRNDRRNDHRNDGHRDGRRDDRRWDGRRDDHRWNDGRHYDHNFNHRPRYDRRWENGRYHWGAYHRPHGYVTRHWYRGDRLPRVYYSPTYVIRDYHECGLRRPPHGHHWVRVDHHAVLAVIATGVVLDVMYNRFW